MSLKSDVLSILAIICAAATVHAQQAVSSITQSRLFTVASSPGSPSAELSGTEPTEESSDTEEDSFGRQVILNNQERPPSFTIFGDASIFYTTNVDLAPRQTRDDAFLVANAGGAWRRAFSPVLVGDVSITGSIFRYDRARELDFERLSAGTGLSRVLPRVFDVVAFGRYDFTELLNKDGDELLRDHAFAVGAQKIFSFGRPQSVAVGISGVGGISTPDSQQREQAAVFGAYHLQISRSFGADLLYRYAAQFYTEGGRVDHNQTASLIFGWTANRWLRIGGSFSIGRNDSNHLAFEYEVLNAGSGIWLSARF